MDFFKWVAPAFGHFADRWSAETIEGIAEWLRPHMSGDCPKDCAILDVGGGTGAFAKRLHDAIGAQVTVLDPSPDMLRYIPAEGPVHCVQGVAEAMPFEDDTFDAVVVTDAFHHFRDQPGAAAEFRRVVRCGGGVFVEEFDPRGLMRRIVAAEKLVGEPGYFYTPEDLCVFMAANGVEGHCEKVGPISYRFFGKVTG
ncbi:MAG: class I SAM-dependent methyltransferase [Coriobacteriales bacterium]|nr:class I SAM-dependent methyltransferase [Coriobacteriales bacterium]